jgi:hypothetical protein
MAWFSSFSCLLKNGTGAIPFGAMVAGDAAGQFDSSKRERKTWPDP